MGTETDARPQTADPPEPQRSPKAPSLLGSTLGRLDWARAGEAIAKESTPRSPTVNADLTKRITRRYRAEVEKSERDRLRRYVRLDQQVKIMPDQHKMARTVQAELESVQRKAGMEAISYTTWDDTFGSEDMKKRLDFLSGYATNGKSTEELKDDGLYEGEFLYGLRHGKGKHTFQDQVYEGQFMWGHRHGAGVCVKTDGTKTTGTWKSGRLDGSVTILKDGQQIWQGEFKAGKRHGVGQQVFTNGEIYSGGWKDGMMHDRGVYHFTNGDQLEGVWREGRYDGPAYLHRADGSVSRRVYQDGVLVTCQDYFLDSQKFSKEMCRDVMQKHTALWEYPKHALE
ncbi:unnamed protein product [Effrenium voratum]|nr:unnamed protein product [Effrenium voratum]|eukprot:CAMPEP_0181431522 /NCGR_PEP_ID=MMETSP1110-20121109/18292_1 /TAXON_ID=174948 /ORGANISM="Symbiodinium sp., Strain CCMP421" /LENGTH=340 /DNA_ID=CAMNT_0023554891 /DNA_START=46 /DNA_END=1068 /DNA_ORIENTATION=+